MQFKVFLSELKEAEEELYKDFDSKEVSFYWRKGKVTSDDVAISPLHKTLFVLFPPVIPLLLFIFFLFSPFSSKLFYFCFFRTFDIHIRIWLI